MVKKEGYYYFKANGFSRINCLGERAGAYRPLVINDSSSAEQPQRRQNRDEVACQTTQQSHWDVCVLAAFWFVCSSDNFHMYFPLIISGRGRVLSVPLLRKAGVVHVPLLAAHLHIEHEQ